MGQNLRSICSGQAVPLNSQMQKVIQGGKEITTKEAASLRGYLTEAQGRLRNHPVPHRQLSQLRCHITAWTLLFKVPPVFVNRVFLQSLYLYSCLHFS